MLSEDNDSFGVRKNAKLIDEARKHFERPRFLGYGSVDTHHDDHRQLNDEYGFYVRQSGHYLLWVGAHRQTALCFGVRIGSNEWAPHHGKPLPPPDFGDSDYRFWQRDESLLSTPDLLAEHAFGFMEAIYPEKPEKFR